MAKKTRKEKKAQMQKARDARRQKESERISLRSQENQSPPSQPESGRILLETSGGTGAYPSDMRVYSYLGEGQYLEKILDDLQEGENLLWRTGFRRKLLRASEELGLIDDAAVNGLREGGAADSDLELAAQRIHEDYSALRDDQMPEIGKSAVLEWLKGASDGPSDYQAFLGLGMALEDEALLRWYDEAWKTGDLADPETKPVKVLEIKYLINEGEPAAGSDEPRSDLAGGPYTGQPTEGMNLRTFNNLFEDFGLLRETYAGLVREWVSGVQEGRYEDPSAEKILKRFRNHPLHNSVLNQYSVVHDQESDHLPFIFKLALAESQSDLGPDELRALFDDYAELIDRRTKSGAIDEALGLDKFTTRKLQLSVHAVLTAIPPAFSDYLIYREDLQRINDQLKHESSSLTSAQKRNLMEQRWSRSNEISSIEGKIERNYGAGIDDLLAKRSMLKGMVDSMLVGRYFIDNEVGGSPRSFDALNAYVDSVYGSGADSFRPKLVYSAKPGSLMTRKMAVKTLEDYRLEQTSELIDGRNFVLDSEPFN